MADRHVGCGGRSQRLLAKMRQIETVLGPTAKARKELRWRAIDGGEVVEKNDRRLDYRQRFRIMSGSRDGSDGGE